MERLLVVSSKRILYRVLSGNPWDLVGTFLYSDGAFSSSHQQSPSVPRKEGSSVHGQGNVADNALSASKHDCSVKAF